jgi:hypothetical protein
MKAIFPGRIPFPGRQPALQEYGNDLFALVALPLCRPALCAAGTTACANDRKFTRHSRAGWPALASEISSTRFTQVLPSKSEP